MTRRHHPPPPPHPFGKTRAERVEAWRVRAAFGSRDDPVTEIARRVLIAADAKTDADMARLALQALGLDGDKATDRNLEALGEALEDLGRRFTLAHPGEHEEDPPDPGPLAEAVDAGVAAWLYARVKPGEHDEESARRHLRRIAADDPQTAAMLTWALALKPAKRASRGRVR